MNEILIKLLDEREILAQLHAYCRAMDRCDKELGRSVFHADAIIDCGAMFKGTRDAFVEFSLSSHEKLQNHLHRITNVSIVVSELAAGSEAYVDACFRGVANGVAFEMNTRGRYIDRWEKREGRWAISRRRYVHEMDSTRPVEGIRYSCEGKRDRSDLSYRALNLDSLS